MGDKCPNCDAYQNIRRDYCYVCHVILTVQDGRFVLVFLNDDEE